MKYTVMGKWKRDFLDHVYPWQSCLVCGEHNLTNITNINYIKNRGYICPLCQSNLKEYQTCAKCSTFIPLQPGEAPNPDALCSWCREEELPYITDCIGVAPYQGQLRQYILSLKYQNKRSLARPMGDMIARAIKQTGWHLDMITAVPLHPNRLAERGYNQSELLALTVADRLELPYHDSLLQRLKETKKQNKLTRNQREDNLRDAFSPGRRADLAKGKSVLVIDDIITSGATICNCAKALLEADANFVFGAAMAGALDKQKP